MPNENYRIFRISPDFEKFFDVVFTSCIVRITPFFVQETFLNINNNQYRVFAHG